MAVTHRTAGGPAATTRAAAPSAVSGYCACHCFANHNGSNAQNRRGPSGDHACRSPFCSLWVLRLPLQGAHILAAAITMRFAACHSHCFANHNGSNAQNRRGAATTRAAAPSAVSGYCACHCFANHNGSNAQNRRGPSGDPARRSPFCSLWVLRLPLQRARGAQRRPRAPQALLQSLDTAPQPLLQSLDTAERAGVSDGVSE